MHRKNFMIVIGIAVFILVTGLDGFEIVLPDLVYYPLIIFGVTMLALGIFFK